MKNRVMRRCVCAGMMLLALTLGRSMCLASEKLPKPPFKFRAAFTSRINFLNSGSSRVFVPGNESTDTHWFSASDVTRVFNRNDLQFWFWGKYGSVGLDVFTRHSMLVHAPESFGLEATVLVPVRFISPNLELGLEHNSEHNADTGRFAEGRGSDMTGYVVRYTPIRFETHGWELSFRAATYDVQRSKTPYFPTVDAQTFSPADLGDTGSSFGFDVRTKIGRVEVDSRVTLFREKAHAGIASARKRTTILYEYAQRSFYGVFADYRNNIQKRELFGTHTLLLGAIFEFRFIGAE